MNTPSTKIRKPAVAGTFYPSNAVELTKTIAGMYAEVPKTTIDGGLVGLVAPHAGYPYSGRIAAKAFKLLEGESFETVVVVSPSHTVFFKGCAVFDGDGYETPLGVVPIDRDLSDKIADIHPLVYTSSQGHASGSTRGEHALEVQLPFMQVVLGKFKLVAVVMGDQEEDSVRALGEVLGSALKGTNTLLVASTDLSHFHHEKQARRLDGAVQKAIEQYDPEAVLETISTGKGEACGAGPVAAVMQATRRLGGRTVRLLDYATSGETTGQFDEVVGYLSAAIVSAEARKETKPEVGMLKARPKTANDLTAEDRQQLLTIARNAIEAALDHQPYEPPRSARLDFEQGAFVTLTIDGHLRGCIGQIRGREPLYKLIANMAQAAALEDPRFEPVTRDEYDRLEYEISVLTPLERVRDINQIVVGRDGLMIKLDWHSGLLLPQVATAHGWSTVEFLEQTCLKAGLGKNSWKDKFAEIYRFAAVIITDKD
ncbi:AmmeMemoRadiSam system protein B [candidate division GN15 bacterium]|nr:AmmeMemoRadiSam system protein B [candidate division GN15 bacterium]